MLCRKVSQQKQGNCRLQAASVMHCTSLLSAGTLIEAGIWLNTCMHVLSHMHDDSSVIAWSNLGQTNSQMYV
jgi:hypothetical protein